MATPFNTWINFREEIRTEEVNNLPSMTQPDEVLTVRQMLERHVRGLPVSGTEQGVYLPEEIGYIPDYRTLDLTEIHEYRDIYAEQIQRYNNAEPPNGSAADTAPEGGTGQPTTTPPPTTTPVNNPPTAE